MDDTADTLQIEVEAKTGSFEGSLKKMGAAIDATLVDGFAQAGNVLERGLVGAIRSGSIGFSDLRRVALGVINDIASQAAQTLIAGLLPAGAGGEGKAGQGGGLGSILGGGTIGNALSSLLGSVLGLPGRATGGPVAPGRGYVVGERGPELFVPTSAGRIESAYTIGDAARAFGSGSREPKAGPFAVAQQPSRDVRVAITIAAPPGSNGAQSLQRSSRQVASAVRRALSAN